MVCDKKNLSASLEDYLETIYHIVSTKFAARSRDISARLGVSGSSVTEALRNLSSRKLIHYAPYEVITLTPKGKKLAEDVVRRHKALMSFFTTVLGVKSEEAEKTACEMEHFISPPVLDRMIDFVDYMDQNPKIRQSWLASFPLEPTE
jgi:DtxR family transcriptional regulator, Mn-dependent transcriptional regulator